MKVVMNQEDIDGARRVSASCCPIARACNRTIKEYNAFVDRDGILFIDRSVPKTIHPSNEQMAQSPCTKEMVQFIIDFDGRKEVYPIEFEVDFLPLPPEEDEE